MKVLTVGYNKFCGSYWVANSPDPQVRRIDTKALGKTLDLLVSTVIKRRKLFLYVDQDMPASDIGLMKNALADFKGKVQYKTFEKKLERYTGEIK